MKTLEINQGDIFVQTTGYSITRNNFWMVCEVSKTGKTAKVVKLETESVESKGCGNGTEQPILKAWKPEIAFLGGNEVEVRVRERLTGQKQEDGTWKEVKELVIKFPYSEDKGYPWDGKPETYSHWD